MEKTDVEFWNGVSKGMALGVERLIEYRETASQKDKATITECIKELRVESARVARVHAMDIRQGLHFLLDEATS